MTWFASPGCTGNVTEKDSYVVGKCNSVSKKQSVQVVCIPAAMFDETE